MQKWKYLEMTLIGTTLTIGGKVAYHDIAHHMNQLGAQGWELVNVVCRSVCMGGTICNPELGNIYYYYKRPTP